MGLWFSRSMNHHQSCDMTVSSLSYNKGKWSVWITENQKSMDLNNVTSKLRITEKIDMSGRIYGKNLVSSIIPNIYRCDVKKLSVAFQNISFNEFLFLSSKAEFIKFHEVTVKNDDGTVVPVEKLVEVLVNVKDFHYYADPAVTSITSKTFKEIMKIPHFSNLHVFWLNDIPCEFDIEEFDIFMKKNRHIQFYLSFADTISDGFKNRLNVFIDKLIKKVYYDYQPPCIEFPGLEREKIMELREIIDAVDAD